MENNHLTKKEKYLLKKQKKEEERLNLIRQKKKRKIFFIYIPIIVVIAIITIGIVNSRTNTDDGQGTPKIVIDPLAYDAGVVSMGDDAVQYTYEIKNNGDEDLKINRIWTSCMCTTAQLQVNDEIIRSDGRKYGDQESENWKVFGRLQHFKARIMLKERQ